MGLCRALGRRHQGVQLSTAAKEAPGIGLSRFPSCPISLLRGEGSG